MIYLYRLITLLLYCLVYPLGRIRAARANDLWRGRLGLIDPVGPRSIWMHAASVGEMKVLSYLIGYLNKSGTDLSIHATVMTKAGHKTATELLGVTGRKVSLSYFPLDAPSAIRRSLDLINPASLVIAETEIWPNLISQAASRGILIVLVNGRMSAKSFKRYRFIRPMLSRLLGQYDRLFLKTEDDLRRYQRFGVTSGKAVVAGDMKFDAPLLARSEGRRSEMRARVGVTNDSFLLVAGSTRPGEELILARVFDAIRSRHKNFRMVIAPRHVERANEVKALLEERGLPSAVYGDTSITAEIVLVDRMGLLNDLYLAADLAFVGGTMVDIGGHNILEPVWAGTPVVFGPHLSNVAEAADYILAHNYGKKVTSESDLTALLEWVIAGGPAFAVKTENDLRSSPTATVGDYILQRLKGV